MCRQKPQEAVIAHCKYYLPVFASILFRRNILQTPDWTGSRRSFRSSWDIEQHMGLLSSTSSFIGQFLYITGMLLRLVAALVFGRHSLSSWALPVHLRNNYLSSAQSPLNPCASFDQCRSILVEVTLSRPITLWKKWISIRDRNQQYKCLLSGKTEPKTW